MVKEIKMEQPLTALHRMSPAEFKIRLRMQGYDDKYFSDMRFGSRQLRRFLTYWAQDDDGKYIPCVHDLPGLDDIYLASWAIKLVKRPKGYLAKCDKRNKTIKLQANLSNIEQKYTILHELIHFYEFSLWDRYRQILCIYFFKKLCRKIGEKSLLELIHIDEFLFQIGYGHTVLFVLKSLELDLKLHLSPGTIYGYERERNFNPDLDNEGKD
jgi:hypothetical protein